MLVTFFQKWTINGLSSRNGLTDGHINGLSSRNRLTDGPCTWTFFQKLTDWRSRNGLTDGPYKWTFFQKWTDWQSIYVLFYRNKLTDGPYMRFFQKWTDWRSIYKDFFQKWTDWRSIYKDFLPETDWLTVHVWICLLKWTGWRSIYGLSTTRLYYGPSRPYVIIYSRSILSNPDWFVQVYIYMYIYYIYICICIYIYIYQKDWARSIPSVYLLLFWNLLSELAWGLGPGPSGSAWRPCWEPSLLASWRYFIQSSTLNQVSKHLVQV